MVVVDADCKIVPDRIAGESDNLYVASLNIWTQVHKPLNHPIDVNRFIYPIRIQVFSQRKSEKDRLYLYYAIAYLSFFSILYEAEILIAASSNKIPGGLFTSLP